MIVFDLKCSHAHIFEAWFGSSEEYESQFERGLISCPICGDGRIEKAVMAPAVSAKSSQRSSQEPTASPGVQSVSAGDTKRALEKLAKVQAEMLQNSEWVGDKFSQVARAMHYGEKEPAPIHGEAAIEDVKSLIEEGVEIAPLPLPIAPPASKN